MNTDWTRDGIIEEVKRLAIRIGQTPGKARFQRETDISKSYWEGCYWASWSDLVAEAGLNPNSAPPKIPENDLLDHYARAVRHFRNIPSRPQFRIYRQKNPNCPGDTTLFNRFGNKQSLNAALWKFVQENSQFHDLVDIIPKPNDDDATNSSEEGYVYLYKMGRYLQDRPK